MAFAIRADADALQLAVVLLVVVTAGSHGAVNGLVVHKKSLHIQESGDAPGSSMRAMAEDMRFCFFGWMRWIAFIYRRRKAPKDLLNCSRGDVPASDNAG
jgi:hypothetical protein